MLRDFTGSYKTWLGLLPFRILSRILCNLQDGILQDPYRNSTTGEPPPGGTPYNGLYGEAPPEMGTFFRLQVYKRVGISRAEVYEKVEKPVI